MEAALGALCRAGGWSYAAVWRFHPQDPRWAVRVCVFTVRVMVFLFSGKLLCTFEFWELYYVVFFFPCLFVAH
jgi:hypothetical protein